MTLVAILRPSNFLHPVHMHFEPTKPPSNTAGEAPGGKKLGQWRTATEYYFIGVTYKLLSPDNGKVRSILVINLDSGSGIVEILPLNIDAETWRLLHNLMVLEQRNLGRPRGGTSRHTSSSCCRWHARLRTWTSNRARGSSHTASATTVRLPAASPTSAKGSYSAWMTHRQLPASDV
jgi:hypothetical protein